MHNEMPAVMEKLPVKSHRQHKDTWETLEAMQQKINTAKKLLKVYEELYVADISWETLERLKEELTTHLNYLGISSNNL